MMKEWQIAVLSILAVAALSVLGLFCRYWILAKVFGIVKMWQEIK